METNEQGLTKEEKIMFFILGLILLVAVGVLIIDGFSKKESSANNETPASEVETGEKNTEEQPESLKEEKTEEPSENTESNDNNQENTVSENNESQENKSENSKKDDETENNTEKIGKKNLPYTAVENTSNIKENYSWDFNREVVTEAYAGTTIHVNKNVVLENGVMEEAVVTVRKIVGNRHIIVDTTDDEFLAEYGTYIYSYTHDNVTREIKLQVYNNLSLESINILGLKETYDESLNIEKDTFTNISKNNKKATITETNGIYTITSIDNIKSNEVAIKIKLQTNSDNITSNTRGVKILESSNYHEELQDNEYILLINLNLLSKEETNIITISIDGIEYIFKLNVNLLREQKGEEQTIEKDREVPNDIEFEEPPVIETSEEQSSRIEFTINNNFEILSERVESLEVVP